jgi:hypothetical protein
VQIPSAVAVLGAAPGFFFAASTWLLVLLTQCGEILLVLLTQCGEILSKTTDSDQFSIWVLCVQMSWALSRQNTEVVQQLRTALQQPGMLQADVEEQAYALVLQQVRQAYLLHHHDG